MSHLMRNKPYFADAGAGLHKELLEQLALQCAIGGAVELIKESDFVKFRDKGFSICKAIRNDNGRAVKVFDKIHKRQMVSIPDFVDYRKDIIIEIKTLHFRSSPDQGGIFVTEFSKPAIPLEYKNVTEKFGGYSTAKCATKYEAQFERYKLAYLKATGRVATLQVNIFPYAKVNR